ncbi:hypothetical protein LTR50_003034 [Elasticomyces elasticus]|nr:hypothetical protein LTR50_003034 [Elasticomyces elasticus]
MGLNPRLNIALNSTLSAMWITGFGMLAWWMTGTLTHFCDVQTWNDETGIMVCRIYKALFTFSLLGLVSTLCALGLDIYVRRQQTLRGVYRLQDIHHDTKPHPPAVRGPFTDDDDDDDNNNSYSKPPAHPPHAPYNTPYDTAAHQRRDSDIFEPARAYADRPGAAGVDGTAMRKKQGYSVPEDQFGYDTGYHGGHAERVFGRS